MEPVVSLTPQEMMNLRTYVQNAYLRTTKTIGLFGYDGPKSGRTQGKLEENRTTNTREYHNCTSWVCLAPIGKHNESLLSLVKGSPNIEVFTSPGWWQLWLSTITPKERSINVVWERILKLEEALEHVQPNKKLEWDFNTDPAPATPQTPTQTTPTPTIN